MVYNCAAEFGRWNGEDYFEQVWKSNLIGLKNIIRLQEKHDFKLIHFSSSEVYGDYEGMSVQVKQYKLADYLKAINYSKEKLLDSEDKDWERKYPPFIINKGLSFFEDTVMFANEINRLHHLPKKMQFDFLLNSIRSRKRFSKWFKASKLTNLDIVKKYYGFSNEKAKQALDILTKEQIDFIKKVLYQGGRK